MTRFDVTTLGEAMLRLSVPAGEPLETMSKLDVHLGGAESNVCAALASLGRRCSWLSRVPTGSLGRYVLRTLRAAGIDTSAVVLADHGRLGTYYVEFAAPPRTTNVVYDRAGSAITELTSDKVDWNVLLDTKVLHLTGITPALGAGCSALAVEAAKRAKARGISVSFDVNYRSKLWSAKDAKEHFEHLLPYLDLLICGQGDAQAVFELQGSAAEVLTALQKTTPAKHIILTQSQMGAVMFIDEELVRVPARPVTVLDRLGAGDAFAAGVLDGFLDGDMLLGLQRGVALSALVLTQYGDMLVTDAEALFATLHNGPKDLDR